MRHGADVNVKEKPGKAEIFAKQNDFLGYEFGIADV